MNIKDEFSVEELETALLNPNSILNDVHIPLLKVGALHFSSVFVKKFSMDC